MRPPSAGAADIGERLPTGVLRAGVGGVCTPIRQRLTSLCLPHRAQRRSERSIFLAFESRLQIWLMVCRGLKCSDADRQSSHWPSGPMPSRNASHLGGMRHKGPEQPLCAEERGFRTRTAIDPGFVFV